MAVPASAMVDIWDPSIPAVPKARPKPRKKGMMVAATAKQEEQDAGQPPTSSVVATDCKVDEHDAEKKGLNKLQPKVDCKVTDVEWLKSFETRLEQLLAYRRELKEEERGKRRRRRSLRGGDEDEDAEIIQVSDRDEEGVDPDRERGKRRRRRRSRRKEDADEDAEHIAVVDYF